VVTVRVSFTSCGCEKRQAPVEIDRVERCRLQNVREPGGGAMAAQSHVRWAT
jgi:hypothetical protein